MELDGIALGSEEVIWIGEHRWVEKGKREWNLGSEVEKKGKRNRREGNGSFRRDMGRR